MSLKVSSTSPANGIHITDISDEKFISDAIVIRFTTPIDEKLTPIYSLLLSLLAESCRKYPDRALLGNRLAELYGTSLYPISYKSGDCFVTGLAVSGLCDRLTINSEVISVKCAELLLDCIFDPDVCDGVFCGRYLEQGKRELIDKIENEIANRQAYAGRQSLKTAFRGEPVAVSLNGTKENALEIDAQTIEQAYKKLLSEAFISVSFTGSGKNIRAKEMVKERLIKLALSSPNRLHYDNLIAPSPCKSEPEYVTEEMEQSQSNLIMFFKTDSSDFSALKLVDLLFGGVPFSRLFINVREKLSLCYYCNSMYDEAKRTMIVDCGVEPGNEQRAADEIIKQLDELKNGSFTDEELENTKRYMKGAALSKYDSPAGLNSWYYSENSFGRNNSPEEAIGLFYEISRERMAKAAQSLKLDTVYVLRPCGGENNA